MSRKLISNKSYYFLITVLLVVLFVSKSTVCAMYAVDFVDASNITGKIICGYQGWFSCEDDGSLVGTKVGWKHWSLDVDGNLKNAPSKGNTKFELYPDISEYPLSALFQTGYANLGNGQAAKLFSSYSDEVIDIHFSWMQSYGIDGIALQRFHVDDPLSGYYGDDWFVITQNEIAEKIKSAAEAYGRIFYVMYDISEMSVETTEERTEFIEVIKKDWEEWVANVNQLDLISSPQYIKQDGKPVVAIWGIGFKNCPKHPIKDHRPSTAEQFNNLINWFKDRGCYVVGGVPIDWRTGERGETKEGFEDVYKNLDMITPWTVGRYSTDEEVDNYKGSLLIPDRDYCNAHGIDYQPVIFPGFAWSNWNSDKRNEIPRRSGKLFWKQAYNIATAGIPNTYIAMFDEYDEGTAIAKGAEDYSMIPTDQYFLTLSADGTYISSDFYLRLAGKATHMIKGWELPEDEVPIPCANGPVFFRTSVEKNYDAAVTWIDTLDTTGGGEVNVIGYGGIGDPECGVVEGEQTHIGKFAIRYAGLDTSDSDSYYYFKVFDVDVPITADTKLMFWIYPQQELGRYVSVDLVMTDGTTLRDSGAIDHNGISMHPGAGRGSIGTWSQIICNIGQWLNGKTIDRILIAYDYAPSIGNFRGYIDDIVITNSETPEAVKLIDVALIIDSSGSMTWNDPQDLRKEAAKIFIDTAQNNDQIAIVDFDSWSYLRWSLQPLTENRDNIKSAVDLIDSSGGTSLSAGLLEGYNQLNSSTQPYKKAAVFLTDGMGSYNNEADLYKNENNDNDCWPIYTIGLGYSTNSALLQSIADTTGGKYFALTDPNQLQNVYFEIATQISGGNLLASESSVMSTGDTYIASVAVPTGQQSATFLTTWPGSDVNTTLTSPGGAEITPATSDPNIYYAKGLTYELYRITNPEAGVWAISLYGADLAIGGETVNISVSSVGPPAPQDTTPPVITISSPIDGKIYFDHLPTSFKFTVEDPETVATSQTVLLNGNPINNNDNILLTQLGENTLTITATNEANLTSELSITFYVNHFSWLPPIRYQAGSATETLTSVIQANSTLPLKFAIFDANSSFIEDTTVKVVVEGTTAQFTHGEGDTNIRINQEEGEEPLYIVNLHTNFNKCDYGLEAGNEYNLTIYFNDILAARTKLRIE